MSNTSYHSDPLNSRASPSGSSPSAGASAMDVTDARVDSVVQEAAVDIAAADRAVNTKRPAYDLVQPAYASAMNHGQKQLPPVPPLTQTSNYAASHRPFVTMSDLFNLLHTAETEGRLDPEKGSRLRHVLIDAENASHSSGNCWMDVVFRVMCELIPSPVYQAGSVAATSMNTRMCATKPLKIHHQVYQQNILYSAPLTQASQPLSKEFDVGTATKQGIGNDDAVAALLDMKMKPSPTNSTNKRKASQELPSEPSSKTQATAIYPYPFSTLKDPKLYRRTRCKAPNCPNNGGACPDHGHDIKVCKVEDCTNRAVKSGVCSKHGAKRPLCRVDGCTNQAKREGRCIKHGAVYGNCSEEGCVNQARSGGLCRKHGAK